MFKVRYLTNKSILSRWLSRLILENIVVRVIEHDELPAKVIVTLPEGITMEQIDIEDLVSSFRASLESTIKIAEAGDMGFNLQSPN